MLHPLIKKTALGLALASLWAAPVFAAFTVPAAPSGYVLDQANVLSDATESQLQTELGALDKETSTQMVVVTLSDLQGYEPEQAALAIGRSWGVGQKGSDNGVVFLIAPTERVARIEVGYGLEGAITDAQSFQILNDVALPAFADGNYDQGTLDTMSDLEALARGETFTLPTTDTTSTFTDLITQNALFFIALIWFLVNIMASSKSWWLGGVFGGLLGLIMGGFIGLGLGAGLGLLTDFILSKYFYQHFQGRPGLWFFMGGRGGRGGSGGGFGGFGGGGFGGGGASGHF